MILKEKTKERVVHKETLKGSEGRHLEIHPAFFFLIKLLVKKYDLNLYEVFNTTVGI